MRLLPVWGSLTAYGEERGERREERGERRVLM